MAFMNAFGVHSGALSGKNNKKRRSDVPVPRLRASSARVWELQGSLETVLEVVQIEEFTRNLKYIM